MSANDILDVLNIQRDEATQPKKKQKTESQPQPQKGGMARELYNLLGPNTPPVNMAMGPGSKIKDRKLMKVSPWTKMPFVPNKQAKGGPTLYHWEKGSRELLEQGRENKPYFFDKFIVSIDIPELVDEEKYNKFMEEVKAKNEQKKKEREEREAKHKEEVKKAEEAKKAKEEANIKKEDEDKSEKSDLNGPASKDKKDKEESKEESKEVSVETQEEPEREWTYEETKLLFELCKTFELKWPVVYDRFPARDRKLEDLKEQFYRISSLTLKDSGTGNPHLLESLDAFSKLAELDRKQYLENLLKRTPAEIAEEESLVIEARRFELAAKKMLMERSNLLTLLDLPQASQLVLQYQSSQGLTNLYNNLMIMDKHQKKKQLQQRAASTNDPVPPAIPMAASSSFKKDKAFQTHLQQYLSGVLKQQQSSGQHVKGEPNAIQLLLAKRLTPKEEEAYGLHYHANERLTPGVMLRSSHRLPGLQQRQSVFKSINLLLQELDIPTVGGTTWKPVMPTRKTMAKYDELIRASVALLEVKKGKDKMEAEIELIKSQQGLQ
ncbi:hypothetical protein C7M61_002208 [Candidozyma pseudohaemuli]|uniref:SWR1-complex protein 4 n=1 Tax=Candidozyma pseudohaemuli TaxID=418784 RepID=A0A2P7YSF9_9ASCO|nr:hypothetical protein C7M61_002208 [[Candida] pseudohaemulonii]PSK38903.1 hypothetical protein C7M61_002208 [[Candida] pseudohaemulonii]